MSDIRPARSDVEELAHRRRRATARQSRNTEREALLQKLIETERKALELRGLVAQWETKGAASPEIRRLIKWAKETLSDMERFLLPSELTKLLETRDLFPDVDDLADPLGDPPPLRPWGR
jgi:transcriptional regulator with XRE-family HTH domain